MTTRNQNQEKAHEFMRKSDFHSAIGHLVVGLQQWGNHVLVLCDLASCYYMVNDYLNFQKTTLLLWTEFQECKPKLCKETFESVSLGLGKLLEELGELDKALDLYEIGQSAPIQNRFTQKLLAQKLRVLAMFPQHEDLSRLFMACEHFNIQNDNAEIDLQSALIHADASLFGIKSAVVRLKKILEKPTTLEHERRLLAFDLCFDSLMQKQSSDFDFSLISNLNYYGVDPFEQVVWDLYLIDQKQTPYQSVTIQRTEGLSPFCSLRYLYLLQARPELDDIQIQALKKFKVLLNTLSHFSKKLITNHWTLNELKSLEILVQEDSVSCGNAKIPLKRQAQLRLLLDMVQDLQTISTEHIVKTLYGIDLDETSYARLKVFIGRSNKWLGEQLGVANTFVLNKNSLQLNTQIKIKRSA